MVILQKTRCTLLIFLLLLFPLLSAVTQITACEQPLNASGEWYYLSGNLSISGATCLNVIAANITLDCAGFSITGNNSTGTFGIYTNQFNTTIRGCNIGNFATGIFFETADNGTISNSNASTSQNASGNNGYGIYLYNGSNYNQITGSRANSTANNPAKGTGVYLNLNSIYNVINNSIAASTFGNGLFINSGSNWNTISRCELSSSSTSAAYAVYISNSHNNTLEQCNATSGTTTAFYVVQSTYNNITNCKVRVLTATTGHGIRLLTSSHYNRIIGTEVFSGANGIYINSNGGNNVFIDCQGVSISGKNSSSGIKLEGGADIIAQNCNISNFSSAINLSGATGALFLNNTFTPDNARTQPHVFISNLSSNNTFCLNNFTVTSGVYVNDTNGGNFYNCTYESKNQGNI